MEKLIRIGLTVNCGRLEQLESGNAMSLRIHPIALNRFLCNNLASWSKKWCSIGNQSVESSRSEWHSYLGTRRSSRWGIRGDGVGHCAWRREREAIRCRRRRHSEIRKVSEHQDSSETWTIEIRRSEIRK